MAANVVYYPSFFPIFAAEEIQASGVIQAASFGIGASGPTWTAGTGAPSGAPAGGKGSIFSRTDGGAGSTLYVWTGAAWTVAA
jgi:hypothetical protein